MGTIEATVATSKASSPSVVGLVIQTALVAILYVALVSAVDLGSTLIGGMMLQFGDGNTALPLHSLHLIAFRGYWIALGISFVAALARKWTQTLTHGLSDEGNGYGIFDAAASMGSIVALVLAVVCLVGYTTVFDWWMSFFGSDTEIPTKGTYLLWAVVMLIVTIFEWIASNKIAGVFAGNFETFELRHVITWAVAPIFSLAIAVLGLVAVGCILGLVAGAILVTVGIPLFIGLCLTAFLLSR